MKEKSTKHFKVTPAEKRKYVLSKSSDFEILYKCKELQRLKLTKQDRFLVKFIKTQLEDNWRRPLLKTLDKLLKKYK